MGAYRGLDRNVQGSNHKFWYVIVIVLVTIATILCYTQLMRIIRLPESSSYLEDGYRLLQSEQYDQAVAAFTKAIEVGNDIARAYSGRGDSYLGLRHYDKAVNDYTIALKYNRAPSVMASRCSAYRMLAKFELARIDCETAINLDPQDADARVSFSLLHLELKDYAQARAEIETAIRIDPNTVNAYYALFQLETLEGRMDMAVDALSKCIELDQTNPLWRWERGFLYYTMGKIELSIEDMHAVLKYGNPDVHGELMFRAGALLSYLGKTP